MLFYHHLSVTQEEIKTPSFAPMLIGRAATNISTKLFAVWKLNFYRSQHKQNFFRRYERSRCNILCCAEVTTSEEGAEKNSHFVGHVKDQRGDGDEDQAHPEDP